MTPLAPRETVTTPSRPCDALGMKTPVVLASAACTISGGRTICGKCGEPISSSPSATKTRLTGSFRPAPLKAWSAARKAASGPFWFDGAAADDALAEPRLVHDRRVERGRGPLGRVHLLDVVHEVEATVRGAPASSVAKTPGWPSVGTRTARSKPASRQHPDQEVAALRHPAVLGRDGRLPDPLLQPRDRLVVPLRNLGEDRAERSAADFFVAGGGNASVAAPAVMP